MLPDEVIGMALAKKLRAFDEMTEAQNAHAEANSEYHNAVTAFFNSRGLKSGRTVAYIDGVPYLITLFSSLDDGLSQITYELMTC